MNRHYLGSLLVPILLLVATMVNGGPFGACRTSADQVISPQINGSHPSPLCGSFKERQNRLIQRFQRSSEVVFSVTQNNVTYWIGSSQKLETEVPDELYENMRDVLLKKALGDIKKRCFVAVRDIQASKIQPGTLRMILSLLSNELMDPRNHLFTSAAASRTEHMSRNSVLEIERFPHRASNAGYLSPELYEKCGGRAKGDLYLKSIGHVIGLAILSRQFLDVSFTSSFYKFILGKTIDIYDIQLINPQIYLELKSILDSKVFHGTSVTSENKHQVFESAVDSFVNSHIAPAMNALCSGLFEIIPKEALAMFNEKELKVLISGNTRIDTGEWRRYASLGNLVYVSNTQTIEWFWKMVNEWDMDMRSRLLLFVTGTSRLPISGFKSVDRFYKSSSWFKINGLKHSTDGHPRANPMARILYLPNYSSYEVLEANFRATVLLNGGVSTWYRSTGHLRFAQK